LSLPERPPPLEVELVANDGNVDWLVDVKDRISVLEVVTQLLVDVEEVLPKLDSELGVLVAVVGELGRSTARHLRGIALADSICSVDEN